ncbi:MAG TPA: SoxR reducing system RseC family protein [Prolixibacteraceae bacterium]|nr:SoxR reducing system RseC family protein [Prolixibacteraceae bacterium]
MELLRHTGIVKKITSTSLIVTIVNQSACSGCHAGGACSVADMQEKEIEISRFSKNYTVGQPVTVIFRESSGFKALFLGYLLPFIVLFSTLVIASAITGNEILSGLLALAVLVPYYAILYLFRGRLKKVFKFEIEETI